MVTLRFELPLDFSIVYTGYTHLKEAEEAFKAVDDPIFDCWIVEVFNAVSKFYVVMPRETFDILRRHEFTLFNQRWEIARYK